MLPIGYMYKKVCPRPDWLETNQVRDLYSVSNCFSEDFADWINFWKHNGYWLFDSPAVIEKLALGNGLSLDGMTLFYYRAFEKQWHTASGTWEDYAPEKSFVTDVKPPEISRLEGFDVVSYYARTSAECSPLSCNHMAREIAVNEHCLLDSLDHATALLESGVFDDCEPGPYRIIEVHTLEA